MLCVAAGVTPDRWSDEATFDAIVETEGYRSFYLCDGRVRLHAFKVGGHNYIWPMNWRKYAVELSKLPCAPPDRFVCSADDVAWEQRYHVSQWWTGCEAAERAEAAHARKGFGFASSRCMLM